MTQDTIGIEAYPLMWPLARPRTHPNDREHARFKATRGYAVMGIMSEVQLLVGKWSNPQTVISTNLALRRDGLPMASQRVPDDPGVAVYFMRKGKQMSFACDRWNKIEHNMQAIAKTIEALRGIERWGTGDMLEAAFTGFLALPLGPTWRSVLGFTPHEPLTRDAVQQACRKLASIHHPDRGGKDFDLWHSINEARDRALQEVLQ